MSEEQPIEAQHRKRSFTCPHCGAHAQQHWGICTAFDVDDQTVDPDPRVEISTCEACRRIAIWRTFPDVFVGTQVELLHPRATPSEVPRLNPDAPEDVARLYAEAVAVVAMSPRAASALLRLALEALLKDLYPDEDNLSKLIGLAVANGLPHRVRMTMDVLRFNGNQSVHDLRHEDTQETALTLFQLLNIAVDHLVTQPKQLDEMYELLPEGFRAHVERRDGNSA